MSRPWKYRVARFAWRYLGNPVYRAAIRLGVAPHHILLETTGRGTGRHRLVPVRVGEEQGSLWVVSVIGRNASWVRNVEARPRVRVHWRRRWHDADAWIVAGDDPRVRARRIWGATERRFARKLDPAAVTVRIDMANRSDSPVQGRPA